MQQLYRGPKPGALWDIGSCRMKLDDLRPEVYQFIFTWVLTFKERLACPPIFDEIAVFALEELGHQQLRSSSAIVNLGQPYDSFW